MEILINFIRDQSVKHIIQVNIIFQLIGVWQSTGDQYLYRFLLSRCMVVYKSLLAERDLHLCKVEYNICLRC